jgi:hypothetical protein
MNVCSFGRAIRFASGISWLASLLLAGCGGASTSGVASSVEPSVPGRAIVHGAAALDVATLTGLPNDQKLMLVSLQGLANRSGAQVYLIPQFSLEGSNFWLSQLLVSKTIHKNPWDLVAKYAGLIHGSVVYDAAIPETINLATTLAGLNNLVVASPAVAARLQSTYHIPITTDFRGKFPDDLTAQTWAFTNLWPQTTHAMIVDIDPSDPADLRDYAVANKAMVVQLHVGVPAEANLLGQIVDQMPPFSPYLGWFSLTGSSSEVPSVRFLSAHGSYDVCANQVDNLSVFSQMPAALEKSQPAVAAPLLENKVYLTFTLSDGDNMTLLQHIRPAAWNSPVRGTVPINWTVSPLLATYAPTMLAYYQRTATLDDYLITGISGAGYSYPARLPAAAFTAYVQQTANAMQLAAMTVPFVENDPPQLDLPSLSPFDSTIKPLGAETFAPGGQLVTIDNQTPIVAAQYATSVADVQNNIAHRVAAWDGKSPLFIAFIMSTWSLGPADVKTIAGSLDSRYSVVREDQFFRLIRTAYNLPQP